MRKRSQRRSPLRKAKASLKRPPAPMSAVIRETTRLWRQAHLTYDHVIQVSKYARAKLELARPAKRPTVVDRLSRDEERKLIARAYRARGARGLLVKTLLLSGGRVSEFVGLKVSDFFFEECMLRIGVVPASLRKTTVAYSTHGGPPLTLWPAPIWSLAGAVFYASPSPRIDPHFRA